MPPDFLNLVQIAAIVGAIIYGAGKIVGSMTTTTATLKSGLDRVSQDLEGLSRDVNTLGQLASSLQEAIGGLAARVETIERAGSAAAAAAQEAAEAVRKKRATTRPKNRVRKR